VAGIAENEVDEPWRAIRRGRSPNGMDRWIALAEQVLADDDPDLPVVLPAHIRRGGCELRRTHIGRGLVDFSFSAGTVARWELRSILHRPSSYIVLLATTFAGGWSFWWLLALLARGGGVTLRSADDPIVQFVGPNVFLVGICTLLVPLLTMSLVADERRRGTWELLLTSPVSHGEAIVGKFLATWCLLLAALAPWPYYLAVLRWWNGGTRMVWGFVPWFAETGLPFDPGPVVGGMVGLAMIGATFVSLGIVCSSLCRRPVSAAIGAFVAMSALLVIGFLPRILVNQGFASERLLWIESISCWGHLARFASGAILPHVITGHLSACLALLWLATQFSRWIDDG
jgi:ABC-2 type transport system permease protein